MGLVVDRWGNRWTLAQHVKDLTPEQLQSATSEFVAKMAKGQT